MPVDLPPYHRLGIGKYGGLARPYALAGHLVSVRVLLE